MSLISKITGMFAGPDVTGEGSNALLVVDATSLGQGQKPPKGGQRLSPRDQIDVLQQLSRVNRTELFGVEAVFEGQPLRKVDHGHMFDDIVVYFQEEAKDVPDFIFSRAKANAGRKQVTVVTSNRRLEERLASAGIQTIRTSTFKKAFDKGAGGGRDGGGRDGGNKRRRPPRRRGEKRPDREPKGEQKPKESDAQDDVSQLIDLVD